MGRLLKSTHELDIDDYFLVCLAEKIRDTKWRPYLQTSHQCLLLGSFDDKTLAMLKNPNVKFPG